MTAVDPGGEQSSSAAGRVTDGVKRWVRRGVNRLRSRERPAVFRAMRMTGATVAAYVAALVLLPGTVPVIAALTALLVVEVTMFDIVTSGVQRVVSVVSGVLLAVWFSSFVDITRWSLGILVAASILRFREEPRPGARQAPAHGRPPRTAGPRTLARPNSSPTVTTGPRRPGGRRAARPAQPFPATTRHDQRFGPFDVVGQHQKDQNVDLEGSAGRGRGTDRPRDGVAAGRSSRGSE